MTDDHPNEPGPLPPQAVDVPFLITASELRDRKNKRRRKQDDLPGRSEAIRDLAAVQIDRLADSDAPAEERASRKRHLLKGPEEFREVRVDRVKKK